MKSAIASIIFGICLSLVANWLFPSRNAPMLIIEVFGSLAIIIALTLYLTRDKKGRQ